MKEDNEEMSEREQKQQKRKRRCVFAVVIIVLLIMLLFIIILILALTVFKPKQPRTHILSATVDGVSPRVSFPAIDIQLNITLNLQILVENRNHASFKHGPGKSFLLYQNNQVGEADLSPGLMPAMGSTTLPCRLTLQLDEFASHITDLIRDVLAGEIIMETRTRIPGRVTFLGIFKKHVVATSECRFTIGFPSMKVKKQDCKNNTKL